MRYLCFASIFLGLLIFDPKAATFRVLGLHYSCCNSWCLCQKFWKQCIDRHQTFLVQCLLTSPRCHYHQHHIVCFLLFLGPIGNGHPFLGPKGSGYHGKFVTLTKNSLISNMENSTWHKVTSKSWIWLFNTFNHHRFLQNITWHKEFILPKKRSAHLAFEESNNPKINQIY